MSDNRIELVGEKSPLLAVSSVTKKVNSNPTTETVLSEATDCVSNGNRGISKNASIRYHRGAAAQSVASGRREFLNVKQRSFNNMAASRALAFAIGVVYTVVALAIAAASLGYRYDFQNDGFGFRALLEGTALLSSVTFLASLGLIFGVVESRSSFISAWLVVQVVVPLYSAAFYAWAIFASGLKNDFGPVHSAVPILAIIAAVHIVLMIGCTMAVNNYYVFLQKSELLRKKEASLE